MKEHFSVCLPPSKVPSRLYVTGNGQLAWGEVAERESALEAGLNPGPDGSGLRKENSGLWTDTALKVLAEDLRKDAAFRLFLGSETYKKEVAIPFHQAFWGHKTKITDLVLKSNDFKGSTLDSRNMVPDIIWQEPNTASVFLTEMQREKQLFFGDRISLYEGKARCLFALKGNNWDYKQVPIYVLGMADFDLNRKSRVDYMHEFISTNQNDPEEMFCGKDWKMLVDLPKFRKKAPADYSERDKWLFILNNFHNLKQTPAFLKGGIFEDVIEIAKKINQTKMEEFMNMLDEIHWQGRIRKIERLTRAHVEKCVRAEVKEEVKAEVKAEIKAEAVEQGKIETIRLFLANCPNNFKKSVKETAALFQVDEQLIRSLMPV